LAERVAVDVPLSRLSEAVGPVVARYAAERRTGEGFGEFCHRVGSAEIETLIPNLSKRRPRS
jgi:sulfite reductase beta subunit-like hemoprotein